MLRVVLDTSVLVSGLRSQKGASFAILRLVAESRITPLVTTPLFLEYEAVLKRPEHQLASGLNIEQIDSFLAAFASAAAGVDTHFRWRPQLKDSNDEMVLECTINGEASVLVTHNVKDFKSAVDRFNLRLQTPAEFLQDIAL